MYFEVRIIRNELNYFIWFSLEFIGARCWVGWRVLQVEFLQPLNFKRLVVFSLDMNVDRVKIPKSYDVLYQPYL